jgi:hypothetical protein
VYGTRTSWPTCEASHPDAGALPPLVLRRWTLVTLESMPLPSRLTMLTSSHGTESASGEGALATALPVTRLPSLPGRPGGMFAEGFAVLVKELCVGSLQRPSELRSVTLAGVDLVTLRMDPEKKFFAHRWLDLRGDLLRGNIGRKDRDRGGDQRGTCQSANAIAHGTFSPCG